jgi:hypothetical protein
MAEWPQISIDTILDDTSGPQSPNTARYNRILQHRSTEATVALANKLNGVMETIHRVGQLLDARASELKDQSRAISDAQSRQQKAVFLLTGVIAVSTAMYTGITAWSVYVAHEGNEIQRQLLELQKKPAPTTPAHS